MFGIYLPEKRAIYRPESGLEPVNVLRTVRGSEVGAAGYGKDCRYHALRIQNGRRDILVQECPEELADSTDEFFISKMMAAEAAGKKQEDRLVLILEGELATSGWIVDAGDFTPEQRRDARVTLAKML